MSKNFDGLDEALGIDHDINLPQVQVMGPEESKAVVQAEDDAEYARRNIREIIEKSRETQAQRLIRLPDTTRKLRST